LNSLSSSVAFCSGVHEKIFPSSSGFLRLLLHGVDNQGGITLIAALIRRIVAEAVASSIRRI
jgi:hypothetical protein